VTSSFFHSCFTDLRLDQSRLGEWIARPRISFNKGPAHCGLTSLGSLSTFRPLMNCLLYLVLLRFAPAHPRVLFAPVRGRYPVLVASSAFFPSGGRAVLRLASIRSRGISCSCICVGELPVALRELPSGRTGPFLPFFHKYRERGPLPIQNPLPVHLPRYPASQVFLHLFRKELRAPSPVIADHPLAQSFCATSLRSNLPCHLDSETERTSSYLVA